MEKASSRFLTQEERRELLRQHKLERDGRRKDRLKFLLLKDEGWHYEQIAKALFLDDQTLRNYWLEYQAKGLHSLLSFKYQGRPSKLLWTEYQALKQHLSDYTYHTASQVTAYIKKQYGRIYGRQGVIVLLSKMGFRYSTKWFLVIPIPRGNKLLSSKMKLSKAPLVKAKKFSSLMQSIQLIV